MEAAYEFAWRGELMSFTMQQILEGCSTPPSLFIDLMVEKCQLINHHFFNTRDHLKAVTGVTNMVATLTFHNLALADSKLQVVTITKMPNLEDQLVHLWREVQ